MNSDANTAYLSKAAYLSIGLKVNGQQNLTGLVKFFFTSIW